MIENNDKYLIIKILFIKITFKKKTPKSDIDAIVWWIPFKNLRNAVRNIYYNFNNILIDFHNSVKNMILSNNIHPKSFNKYLNINLNKDVVLLATGPTLNDYIPIKNCINVGVNHAFKYNKVDLDYLFALFNILTIK